MSVTCAGFLTSAATFLITFFGGLVAAACLGGGFFAPVCVTCGFSAMTKSPSAPSWAVRKKIKEISPVHSTQTGSHPVMVEARGERHSGMIHSETACHYDRR